MADIPVLFPPQESIICPLEQDYILRERVTTSRQNKAASPPSLPLQSSHLPSHLPFPLLQSGFLIPCWHRESCIEGLQNYGPSPSVFCARFFIYVLFYFPFVLCVCVCLRGCMCMCMYVCVYLCVCVCVFVFLFVIGLCVSLTVPYPSCVVWSGLWRGREGVGNGTDREGKGSSRSGRAVTHPQRGCELWWWRSQVSRGWIHAHTGRRMDPAHGAPRPRG